MAPKFTSMAGVTGNKRVTLIGQEPVDVRLIGADIIRFEQNHKMSFFKGDVGFTRMAWVAWAAMKRQNLTDLSADQFLANLEDLESEEDEDQSDDEDAEEEGVQLPDPSGGDTTAW